MKSTLTTIAALSVVISATAQDRSVAKASFDEGAVTIRYGSPQWQDAFGDAMSRMDTWRLGANDPTSVKLTCGLMTDDGCIPAGDYKMAAQKNDKGDWNLVVYKGNGHFRSGRPAWTIKPVSATKSDKSADALEIMLSKKKELAIHFGPHKSVYSLQTVKMHNPVTTEFARIPTSVNVMAVPVSDSVKDVFVGTTSCERNGTKVSWDLALTIDGDSATLNFKNDRANAINEELKGIEGTIKRVSGRLEGADDGRKKRIEEFIAEQKSMAKNLRREQAMLEGFKGGKAIDGTVKKTDKMHKTVSFSSERIDGGMVLTFGAGNHEASFKVKPREFLNRRR